MQAPPFPSAPLQVQPAAGWDTPQAATFTATESRPDGLEFLANLSGLQVKQKLEALEIITSFETANRYIISSLANVQGGSVDLLKSEEAGGSCLARQCCGKNRGFDIAITENNASGRQLISAKRDFLCCTCLPCFGACRHEMTVTSPITNQILGRVHMNCYLCKPSLTVYDAEGNVCLIIRCRDLCTCFCSDKVFLIEDPTGTQIGGVTKKFKGLLQEGFTDADTFEVKFPVDLDVKTKAVLLGAVFLIDFSFFESK